MIESAVLANAATSVVADYLKSLLGKQAPDDVELPPDVLKVLQAQIKGLETDDEAPGVVQLSRDAARPEAKQAEVRTISTDVGAAALAISPGDVFREARKQNKRVFLVGLVLSVTLATILVLGVGGVIVTGVFLGRGAAAAAFGGVSLLDVVGFVLTKPFAVIQGASVTNQRLDMAHLRLQEQLLDCAQYADVEARFQCKSRIWDKTQEELRKLSAG